MEISSSVQARFHQLPDFMQGAAWFSMPLPDKLARIRNHAEANPSDVPMRMELEHLEKLSMDKEIARAQAEALRHDTEAFMLSLTAAFRTGDQSTLGRVATLKGQLAQRHKQGSNEERFDFDHAFGLLWEDALPTVLKHAARARGHTDVQVIDRREEHGTRDFTFSSQRNRQRRSFDLDAKATSGPNVVLELSTRSHPEGWFIRAPDGQYIASARLGTAGLHALLIPVDALRQRDAHGRAWWEVHGGTQHNYKGDLMALVSPDDLTKLPGVVDLTPAWRECARTGLLLPSRSCDIGRSLNALH